MTEYIIRFVSGGLIVSAFAILSDLLRPKSFAGLLGAAPSVALVTLGLAVIQHGPHYAAAEGWTMMYGAAALGCYSFIVCQMLVRFGVGALAATMLSLVAWFVVAFGLLTMWGGAG